MKVQIIYHLYLRFQSNQNNFNQKIIKKKIKKDIFVIYTH